MDLFDTKLNHRLQNYVSLVQDPLAWAVDAFSITWNDMLGYAFPPTKLIPEVLSKISREKATVLLIAPAWPASNWFPDLIDLLIDLPVKLPDWKHLLCQPKSDIFHKNISNLKLHVWKLSGNVWLRRDFLKQYPMPLSDLLGHQLHDCITPSGIHFSSGESKTESTPETSPCRI